MRSTSTYSGKVTSWRINSKLLEPSKCAMLRFDPVKKLSTQSTSAPAVTRRSHRWLPRNPAPPVTNMLSLVADRKTISLELNEHYTVARLGVGRITDSCQEPDDLILLQT